MPSVHSNILMICFTIALFVQSVNQKTQIDDQIYQTVKAESAASEYKPPPIITLPPKYVCSEIHDTVFLKHYTGLDESIFGYICDELAFNVTEAQSVDFKHDPVSNY